jgi:hypothetical protein
MHFPAFGRSSVGKMLDRARGQSHRKRSSAARKILAKSESGYVDIRTA